MDRDLLLQVLVIFQNPPSLVLLAEELLKIQLHQLRQRERIFGIRLLFFLKDRSLELSRD